MREIKFRGKHIHTLPANKHLDGKWIYGYLCSENYINSTELGREFLIAQETIGQYTGLKDKNGTEIYEEDFVKINGEWIGRIIWRDGVTAFCVFPNDDIEHETYCLGFYIEEGYGVEVIGNIFDNLDLLKEDN